MKRNTTAIIILALAACLSGCYSVPDQIGEDLSPAQLLQKGQDAYDEGNVKAALKYYNTILDRYSGNMAAVAEAEYNIAHIHYKEGRYEKAAQLFEEILSRYEGDNKEYLPERIRVLCEMMLSEIAAKTGPGDDIVEDTGVDTDTVGTDAE